MSNDNVTPIRPPSTSPPTGFDELQREMMNWLNALSCAAATLAQADVIDQDEMGSRARSTVHACNENLHRLMNDLESWEMRTRREGTTAVRS
jgi:hypothetical protein